jgi:hypothetical protein
LRSFKNVNEEFEYLFQETEVSEGTTLSKEFGRSFGWLYNAKMVSEFEGISIEEVWKIPTIQFLNDLSYLKMKREVDDEHEKRLMNKYKLNANYK